MVSSIHVQNKVTKQEIVLDKTEGTYILNSIDWGTPSVSPTEYRVPFQIGTFHTGVVIGTREISVSGYIIANTNDAKYLGYTWKEYFEKQKEEIENKKAFLNKIFSVFQEVEIEVSEYTISGIPEGAVKYSFAEEENNEVLCYFSVTILCNNPMFESKRRHINMSFMVPMFHFPLIIPEDTGMIFGIVSPRLNILAKNEGDVSVGCVIRMTAHGGEVRDPKILNINTNEYIGFLGVLLHDGEYITIDTRKGQESAIKHVSGGTESLIGNIMDGSTFFQISVGEEYYYYDMDGSEQNLETTIEYSESVFNFKEM